MFKKFFSTTLFILALATSLSSAAVGPVTAITTDNPPGSPPYNILSITVGTYTADRLGTGTTTVGTTLSGTRCPENDDFDINTALNWNLGDTYSTILFGGALWTNSNGDNPDFFMFESGGNAGDDPEVFPIFPDGSVGSMVKIPDQWKTLGYNRVRAVAGDAVDMDGQSLCGMSWAITDMLDASGKPLTNDTTIMGIRFNRSGTDPVGLFAVMPPAISAGQPTPADKATDVLREVVLSWTPGETASAHDVYWGTVFEDVDGADRGNPLTVLISQGQTANTYDPPDLLEFGQTYYWRIDEVAANATVHKGAVWSFTVEPFAYPIEDIIATASSSAPAQGPENTINGSGLDDSGSLHINSSAGTMWESNLTGIQPSWIEYEFDRVYKLHQMQVWNYNETWEPAIGVGFKDVTIEYSVDGSDYATLGTTHEFAQGPGTAGYAHNTKVDFGGVTAKHVRLTANSNWGGILNQYGLSEVRFLYIPVTAREPAPASGATDVDVNVTLAWRAGREAASHKVYFSDSNQAVIDGAVPAVIVADASYSPSPLDLSSMYYWRIDEVNEAETPTTWQGDVWSFSTPEYLAVDDFESYNDIDPPDPESHRIFEAWSDGFGIPTNGALVGNDLPPYAETVTVHGGAQSLPLFYSDTGGATYSEAARTFATPQDWTKHGIQTLVLYFHGTPGNTGQLYVKVNDSKVLYKGNPADIAKPIWKQWNIDLASLGIALQNVTTLGIGIDGNGASGTLYLDDIRLYLVAPVPALEEIWIEAESGSPTAPLMTVDDPTASGGKYISTDDLGLTGAHVDGIATYKFTVKGGVYKLQGRVIEPAANGNSFWVRLPGATLNTTPAAANNGWMNWGFPAGARTWQWSEFANGTTGIRCTLAAGTYTLEIAWREDGAQLDAIVITEVSN